MATPLENALKRLAELKAEVARIERFIKDYRDFSDEPPSVASAANEIGTGGNLSPEESTQPVDNYSGARRRGNTAPSELVKLMERIISDVGRPMTRGELVEAIERRDIEIPAQDKSRYIGTLAWRHKGTFINVEGRGYWLRGRYDNIPSVPPNTPYSDPEEEHSPEADAEEGPRHGWVGKVFFSPKTP
ncbi:MAG: hypothetical protein JO234_09440 [Hyphomicrobiales bacterium]|nr:hypothetical protein [Hyphomicrobiales bacterium]